MFISIHRCLKPNSLRYIVKENRNQRLPNNVLVQLGSMKIPQNSVFLCNKLAENYNNILCLDVFIFSKIENRSLKIY